MHKSRAAIDYNTAAIQQRQWLQHQSQVARKQKQGGKITKMRMNSNNGRGVKNAVDGIFISANGEPMSFVNDESLGDALYDATIHADIPSENILIPGPGGQIQPSTDGLIFNYPQSRETALEVLGQSHRDLLRQGFDLSDINDIMARQDVYGGGLRGPLRGPGPSVESIASQRILDTAFSTPAPTNSRVQNTELDINANGGARNMMSVLNSAAYVPSGGQSLGRVDALIARVKGKTLTPEQKARLASAVIGHATIQSGQGELNAPDVVLNFNLPPSPGMKRPSYYTSKRRSSRSTRGIARLSPGHEAGGAVYESAIGPQGKARGTPGKKITFTPSKKRSSSGIADLTDY
jgi:hypothetical protein